MSSHPRRLPPKKDVMIELLAKSGVFLHLDPRREGVSVPPQFRKQPELVLQVGLNMAVPIRDLEVEDDGVSCTLSFNRSPFWCRMPWTSIFAIVSDEDRRGVVWPEDVPPESKLSGAPAPAPQRPKLRAVGRDEVAPEPAPERLSGAHAAGTAEVEPGEGSCSACGTRWVEDQESCPICGASREEAFEPAAGSDLAGDEAAPPRPAPLPLSVAAAPLLTDEELAAEVRAAEAAAEALAADTRAAEERAASATDPAATGDSASGDAGGSPSEGKPKRQLPPYLRIVK